MSGLYRTIPLAINYYLKLTDLACHTFEKRYPEKISMICIPAPRFHMDKLARAIADLASAENIAPEHIAEAISYRKFDRKL